MNHKTLRVLFLSLSFIAVFTVFVLVEATVTWSDEFRLTTSRTFDIIPSITQMSDGKVWVVWQSFRDGNMELYYKTYDGAWSTLKRLTNNASQDISPTIAQTTDGTIWVIWASDRMGNYDLFYKTSSNNGFSWSNEAQLTTDPNDDLVPSITSTMDGKLWVVWQRNLAGNHEIFYTVFDGSSWSNETRLTDNPNYDKMPSVTQTIDGRIWVAWGRLEDDYEIFYTVFDGSSWSNETRLTDNRDSDTDPAILQARNGLMWVVWVSRKPTPSAYDDLYYTTSLDYGSTWSAATMLSTNSSTDDKWPSAAQVDDKRIWVVWSTDRDEDWEIYYKTSSVITYHDVAITDIAPSSTNLYQGEIVSINVKAENQGDFNESFTVELYADSTTIGSESITLPPESSTTINFSWNTSGFPYGNYIISANASAVPEEILININDNTLIDGTVQVKIPGDVNGDGAVDTLDLSRIEMAYGTTLGDPNWDEEADINHDGIVDLHDLTILGEHYGETI